MVTERNRWSKWLLILGLLLFPVFLYAQSQKSARPYLVELRTWARTNGLKLIWRNNGKVCQIEGAGKTLLLSDESACVQLDGIRVWLSYSTKISHQSAKVHLTDFNNVIVPLMKGGYRMRVKTVVIDPGHGGRDLGYHNGSIAEKKLTLSLAEELKSYLEKAGFKVVLTRTRDTTVPLSDRAEKANLEKADLFISLHFNATDVSAGSAKGVEVYCLTPQDGRSTNTRRPGPSANTPGARFVQESITLAFLVQKNLVKGVGMSDRGVRFANFEVLRLLNMPGILVEAGFLSNPSERKNLTDSRYRSRIAKAIAEAIQAYSLNSNGGSRAR